MVALSSRDVSYVHRGQHDITAVYHGDTFIWPRWWCRRVDAHIGRYSTAPTTEVTFTAHVDPGSTVAFITPDGTSHAATVTRGEPKFTWNIPNDGQTHQVKVHVTKNGTTQEIITYSAQHSTWAMTAAPVGGYVSYGIALNGRSHGWYYGNSHRVPTGLHQNPYNWHYHASAAGHDAIWVTQNQHWGGTGFPPDAMYFKVPTAPPPPRTTPLTADNDTTSFAPLVGVHGTAGSQWVKIQWNGHEEVALVAPDGQYWYYGDHGDAVIRVTEIGPPGRTATTTLGRPAARQHRVTGGVLVDDTALPSVNNQDTYVVGHHPNGSVSPWMHSGSPQNFKPDDVVYWDDGANHWVKVAHSSGDQIEVNGRDAILGRATPGDTSTPLVWKYADDHTMVVGHPKVTANSSHPPTITVRQGVAFEWTLPLQEYQYLGMGDTYWSIIEGPTHRANRELCFTAHGGGITKNGVVMLDGATDGGPAYNLPSSATVTCTINTSCTFTGTLAIEAGTFGDFSPGAAPTLVKIEVMSP